MIWYAQLLLLAPTLFDQSIFRLLQRDFPATQFLLVDADTHELIGGHWVAPERPIPMGSLVKPFSALSGPALKFRCNPRECWRPEGHGEMDLSHAIAESCNSYFLQLNAVAIPEQVRAMTARFHLPNPRDFKPSTLTGIGAQWLISPRQIATAYAALASDESAAAIREGMRMSAKQGTAKALRSEALAKTGTAPCSHAQKAPGDGYVAVLYPASSPRYVLLVQVHGVSGAVAAHTAGEMLKVIRDGK
jgi:cell division protein FtsI/penicillin-binding protein 2